jgi:hypothetical protein
MIRLTKFAHRRLVVLVTSMVVLSSALDGCLLDCHARHRDQDVEATAYTHCHPAPAEQVATPSMQVGAGRWQTDRTCHHNHTSAAAESTARNRVNSRELGVLASFVLHPDRLVASIPPVIRSIADRSTPAADFTPLRV